MKKKTLVAVLVFVLFLGGTIGGTLAWLTSKSGPVTNTFTPGNINIGLSESEEEYTMIPGYEIHKDPKITVSANSEKCYLFVKLEKSGNFDDFMTYEVADGWTQGDGTGIPYNVYYCEVEQKGEDQFFDVLDGNIVKVLENVTKGQMDALKKENYPTLTVTAFASQYMKNNNDPFEPAVAWSNISQNETVTPP